MRPLPELFDVGVKARSLAYLFVAGALLRVLTLLLPHSEDLQDAQLYVLAAIAIAVAALVYVRAERVSEWQLHLVLGAGTTILSFANYYTGTSTLYPPLYTWRSEASRDHRPRPRGLACPASRGPGQRNLHDARVDR